MNKVLLFLLAIIVLGSLKAQSHFILAGQDTGLMHTNIDSGYIFPYSNGIDSAVRFIDINNDGNIDLQVKIVNYVTGDGGYIYFSILPTNASTQLICNYDTGMGYDCNGLIYPGIRQFSSGDTISTGSQFWLDSTEIIFYQEGGVSPSYCYIENNLEFDTSYFIGGYIVSNGDTSLFYLQLGYISTINNYYYGGTEIYDYAIEGKDTTITITGTKNLSNPASIKIYPNPFTNQINLTSATPLQFTIFDYLGRIVKSGISNGMIKTEDLIPGLYMLILRDEENYSVIRVVKN